MNKQKDYNIKKERQTIKQDQLDFVIRRALQENAAVPNVEEEFHKHFHSSSMPTDKYPSRGRLGFYIATCAACLLFAVLLVFEFNDRTAPNSQAFGNIVCKALEIEDSVSIKVAGRDMALGTQHAIEHGIMVKQGNMIHFLSSENVSPKDQITVSIPKEKSIPMQLPDGSRVWLSACSRIFFPNKFVKDSPREVRLIGEAYFEVAHHSNWPFIVHCGNMSTRVLGTTFSIRAFDEEEPQVTLVSGSVEVSTAQQEATLTPGQQATIVSGQLTCNSVNVEAVTSWTQGLFFFEGQTLEQIMKELGHWYNVNVIFVTATHMNDRLHFHGERSWTIRQVIEQLSLIVDAKMSLKGDNLSID